MIGLLTAAAVAATAPNVVLVTIDTLRADRVGAYGYARAETPVLDRLAREGVLLEDAVAHAPQTRPSHASILTGLYPYEHGIRDNDSPPLDPRIETLATALKRRGYATAAFIGAYPVSRPAGFDRGFDLFDDPFGAGERATTRDPRLERVASEVVSPALAWMARSRAQPFLLWLHLFDPHAPYEAPAPYRARFENSPYDGEIAYTDAQLGRIVEWLDRSGVRGNTVLVVTADHGESLGEHGEDEHMVFVYDATLRVPLLVSWPGRLPAGARVRGQFRSVDLLPTLLDLLGGPLVPGSGASRARELTEGRPLPDNESYAESLYGEVHFGWAPLRALRGEGYKLIDAPRQELYRLADDPGETRNLALERRPLAQGMRSRLARHREKEVGPPTAPVTTADPAALERLAALGYVGGRFTGTPSGADPKDRIAAYQSRRRETVRGLRAFRDGDLDTAIRTLVPLSIVSAPGERAGPAEQRSFNVEYFLGRSFLEKGRTREAVRPLEAALAAAPTSIPGRIYLAQALAGSRQSDQALRLLQAGLVRAPDHPELLQSLGGLLLRRGDLDGAAAALEKALAGDPSSVPLRVDLAALYRRRADLRRAGREADEALRLDPGSAAARVEKGLVLGAGGDEPAAARELAAALRSAPAHADALYYLAALERRAGRTAEAVDLLQRLVRTTPDYPGGRGALEEARAGRREQPPALPAEARGPDRSPVLRLRILRMKDRARAEGAWRRAQAGEGFDGLARALSEDPSAAQGGDLGQVRADDLAEPLRSAAQRLRVGETSPVLETPSGFVLLQRFAE